MKLTSSLPPMVGWRTPKHNRLSLTWWSVTWTPLTRGNSNRPKVRAQRSSVTRLPKTRAISNWPSSPRLSAAPHGCGLSFAMVGDSITLSPTSQSWHHRDGQVWKSALLSDQVGFGPCTTGEPCRCSRVTISRFTPSAVSQRGLRAMACTTRSSVSASILSWPGQSPTS